MVNTKTTLTGRNFAPETTLHLTECSTTNWIVGQYLCDTNNTVTVRTNAKGGFKKTFKVEACPAIVPVGPIGLYQLCYIGVPKPFGVDTMTLEATVKIVVTYP